MGGEPVGPLHCVPVIVKDNFDTTDLATTVGSLSLAEFMPEHDAFQVQQIRDVGGIILAKSNMAEFAFSPYKRGLVPSCPGTPETLIALTG